MGRTAQGPSVSRRNSGRDKTADGCAPLAAVLDALDRGVLVVASDLTVSFCNASARELFGCTPRGVGELTSALRLHGTQTNWEAVVRNAIGERMPRRLEAGLSRGNGPRGVHVLIAPLAEATGDAGADATSKKCDQAVIVLHEDAPQFTPTRANSIERLAAVGKLAARVAHELNNPLDGILRYTNLAARRAEGHGDAKLGDYLEQVRTGIHRMAQIVTTLLEFSRSTPGMEERATLHRLIEDAIGTIEDRARAAGITIVCNLRTDLTLARGTGLFQVACNLIRNSIDAMPDGGTLTITADESGDELVLKVEDTGVGLPADMERVFEPFFTTKGPGRGTGLGLAVCRELVEQYGGTIVPSRREPKGTCMTVRVPVQNCATAAAMSVRDAASHQQGAGQ